jgi:hypothetical protein
MKSPVTARLACGCRVGFLQADPGRPVTVRLEHKAATCTLAIHVGGLPIYDHHAATRPTTRVSPPLQPDYEDG